MTEPTDRRTFTPPPTKIRIGDRRWPGMSLQLGGIECVPRDAWDAAAGEIERLREDLRQQQLRQQLAERDVADLKAERALLRTALEQALDGWEAADDGLIQERSGDPDPRIAEIRRTVGLT